MISLKKMANLLDRYDLADNKAVILAKDLPDDATLGSEHI